MATESYLPDVPGGMVTAAAFADDASTHDALRLLGESGVRWQDISVIARSDPRAAALAEGRAWTPSRGRGRLGALLARLLPGGGLPGEVRRRYGRALRDGRVVLVVAAGGQPPDTLAALLAQAGGEQVEQWWQPPAPIFAPPELAGPF
ncbi:MAG TPA: hypothetical protein VMJ92_02055 [Candidatus Limnocylindrales bacterium]|nr:hypothetical protein [Candidatus Limnocylindrales bacterium]